MRRLYSRTFKVGFTVNLLAYFILNVIDYWIVSARYSEYLATPNKWAELRNFPPWGFPFAWNGQNFKVMDGVPLALADGGIVNFIVIVTCGFIVGLLYRSLRLRFETRN